ncbi:MAG: hypothetical protein F6K24_10235 [Okeania sp. SIO2D1]|nr:hypothetical protein [Okeania sp. SIO2D1]
MKRILPLTLGFMLAVVLTFFHSQPVAAQYTNDVPFNRDEWTFFDCPAEGDTGDELDELGIPLALKVKFPFDLVYPVNPLDLSIDEQCQEVTFWGTTRQFCAPMQIAKTAKDVFLLSFFMRSLLAL